MCRPNNKISKAAAQAFIEFRPAEFADDPRTFAPQAIRIICAPNRYGIGDEQTWHRSQTPMPNHAHLPLYIMDHSAVHISLTPFAGAGPDVSHAV